MAGLGPGVYFNRQWPINLGRKVALFCINIDIEASNVANGLITLFCSIRTSDTKYSIEAKNEKIKSQNRGTI